MTPARSADLARALALVRPVQPPAPVLDGARGARDRPDAGRAVRRGLPLDLRRSRARGRVRARRAADRRGCRGRQAQGRAPHVARRLDSPGRARRAVVLASRCRRRGRQRARGAARPGERRGAARAEELRHARARRARAALPPDVAARARNPDAPHPPLREGSRRAAHRHAPDAAREPAHRRRPDQARTPAPARRPAPARAAVRHLGLDGAVHAGVPAVPDGRGRQRPARRGVRLRDAPHAPDARTRLAQSRARDPARGRRRRPTGRAGRGSATR